MGDFRTLQLKSVYNSDDDNVLEHFYIPVLKEAIRYDRAVGFFSAPAFAYAAQGLTVFCQNQGYMRLIIGALPTADEQKAIADGYDLRNILERVAHDIQDLFRIEDTIFENRLRALSWMIATNKLDIKIALRIRGMFHEKVGIMRDNVENMIVFEGSNNETAYALLPDFNYETMHVFPSWISAFKDHFEPHVREFDKIWSGNASRTPVFDLPDPLLDKFRAMAQEGPPEDEAALARLVLMRSEEHTSELQSHSFISYAVFCLKN